MKKRGRPTLPPEERRAHKRVVVCADRSLEMEVRLYAEYHGKTIQGLTREWWEYIIRRANEKNRDLVGASKNT